ncbi:MAG: Methionine aminopeptidase, partial [uncultured Thermomicrobiales bacterium]
APVWRVGGGGSDAPARAYRAGGDDGRAGPARARAHRRSGRYPLVPQLPRPGGSLSRLDLRFPQRDDCARYPRLAHPARGRHHLARCRRDPRRLARRCRHYRSGRPGRRRGPGPHPRHRRGVGGGDRGGPAGRAALRHLGGGGARGTPARTENCAGSYRARYRPPDARTADGAELRHSGRRWRADSASGDDLHYRADLHGRLAGGRGVGGRLDAGDARSLASGSCRAYNRDRRARPRNHPDEKWGL